MKTNSPRLEIGDPHQAVSGIIDPHEVRPCVIQIGDLVLYDVFLPTKRGPA